MTKPTRVKTCRTRISLECSAADKQEILDHMAELGTETLIDTIRAAVRRSRKIHKWERRGPLVLAGANGRRTEVEL